MTSSKSECLKDTVTVLINAASDTENSVSNVVIKSLTKIANVYPNEVVLIICDFYKDSAKANPLQLGNVIKVIEQTCVNEVKRLEPTVTTELVTFMLRAMTENAGYERDVQMGASSVLVAVGHEHLDLVLRSLINQFTPTVPHYTIPHTLGTLAAVNTHSLVPHIKEILSKMLPLLPLVKQDCLKQAFAYAFGHFAIAISEQIGDNVENDNITSIKDNFVTEFSLIFDVLYNQWLPSHEPKVTESVLEALGPITRLISDRQFNDTVNKFVLSLLSLYRKPALNFYYISQCISYMLSPSPLNPKLNLNDNVINNINHVLFNLVLLEPDYDQPQTVKNHFEVLRCFDHMANQFSDHTMDSLLHQCKNNQEKDRMKAVIILTHLTTSSQMFVDSYAARFVAILKVMTAMEQGLRMKKLLVKAIVGLVYRNCIASAEDFALVEFIIKHCGFQPPINANVAKHEVADLHDTCKSSLILMCNTVTSVRSQLRNLLLTSLTIDDFAASMGTVSKCLTSLLQNNTEVADESPTEKEATKVSPDLVFVRCLTHIVDPNETERNKNLLVFLEEYSGDVHKNLKNSWTVEIQRLLKFVNKSESLDQWHGMLLDLLVSAIEQVNNDKWVEVIATLISQQVVAKKQAPMIKGVSLQYLAILSCHMSNAAVVEKILTIIMLALKSIPMESCEYVSKASGIAARQHGEIVMNELDAIYKENEGKRSSKILNFLTPRNYKNEQEFATVKYAVITCYGKVASECLDVHVLARLGENVTSILLEILKSSPPFDLCKASVTTLYEIGKALHPAAHHNVVLRNRWQLLNAVLEQIYNSNLERRNVELYPIIVKASKALTKLQKGILPEERNTIIRVFFNSIFEELCSFKRKYEVDGNGDKNDQLAKTLNDSLTLLHRLIRELIIQSTCLSTIDDLVSLLVEWIRHDNDEIRTASIMILQVILDTYIKNVKLNYETPSKFGQMGYLVGLIIPGIADTNFPVRLTTLDCIKLIIQVQDLYEGRSIEPDDECMSGLNHLQNNVLTNDLNMIADYCMFLCDTIAAKIPHHHTMQFIESLLESYDDQEFRCVGICSILDAFFINKGQDLYQSVERIVEVLIMTMDNVQEDARLKLMKPLISLTRHHSNAVTAVLLGQRLPLKPCVISCWHQLGRDEALAPAITDNFLRLMTSVELYEDPYHVTENHIAALQPLTLITALGEMLQEPSMKSICDQKFPELFSVLYTTLVCYIEAEPPAYAPANKGQERFGFVPNRESIRLSPARITVATFNAFLERAECHKVREACSLCLSIEHGDSAATVSELAPLLCGALCRSVARQCGPVAGALAPYARAALPPQRVAAVALLADMLNYRCNDNKVTIDTVLSTLSIAYSDASPRVVSTALRSSHALTTLQPGHRGAALTRAFTALSHALDVDCNQSPMDNVPLASLQGLGRLLSESDSLDREFDRELLAISQKIRPFMNTECAFMREHSIRLFGIISSRVSAEALDQQAISSLPCFLLHLCDSSPPVVRASKFTLKQVFKTFNAKKSNDLIQTHLLEEGRLFLDEFLTALLRQLADELPESIVSCLRTAVSYLNCARDDMRPHPPLLVGLLYSELYRIMDTLGSDNALEWEVTRGARVRLLHLMKDHNPLVRQHAAMALANICLVDHL